MTVGVEGFGSFKEEYYALSRSSICCQSVDLNGTDCANCSKLDRVHDDGVRFFFSCIGGLAWSLLTLCTVSLHGATPRLKKWTATKWTVTCLFIGFIPECLIILFQIWFSGDNAFCGMDIVFDAVIDDHLKEELELIDAVYFNCDYKNSDILSFPISWIPGCIMVLVLMLLCLYKPLSPMVRRILNTCSCCVNRKVSDSVIPVSRYFSFSGTADAPQKRVIAHGHPGQGGSSVNRKRKL